MTRRRRAPNAPDVAVSSGDFGTAITAFADHVLHGTGDVPNVALGPLVWGIDPGHDRRHWYFVVCSIDAKGDSGLISSRSHAMTVISPSRPVLD